MSSKLKDIRSTASKLKRKLLRTSEPVSWHALMIGKIAEVLRPRIYAEIGVYHGETINLVKHYSRMIYAVDINETFLKIVSTDEKIKPVLGDSQTLSRVLETQNEKIDLLFIDADHSKESVINDFKNLVDFVDRNGIVLFHDTFPASIEFTSSGYCGDAYLAIPKLRELFPDWSFVNIPVHPGLTIAGRKECLPIFSL